MRRSANMRQPLVGEERSGSLIYPLCLTSDMRYDDIMRYFGGQGGLVVLLVCLPMLAAVMAACRSQEASPEGIEGQESPQTSTVNPAIAGTLQAGIAQTAVSVVTVTATATSSEIGVTLDAPIVGTAPADRIGECPVPEGDTLHVRQSFCLSAPAGWTALNVDGGMAGFLRTTPGQALSLQPDWASSTAECHVMVYVSAESSVEEHLAVRHVEVSGLSNLQQVSPIAMQVIGDMGLPGFVWSLTDGTSGGVFAAMLGPEQLLHIGIGGSNCPLEDIAPALNTIHIR